MALTMNEETITKRISDIQEAYAEIIPEDISITLEAVNKTQDASEGFTGDVRVFLEGSTKDGRRKTAEKVIHYDDDLSWVEDTFTYPDYIGRQSKDINSESVKMAHLDVYGDLMVYKANSAEKFKIKQNHKDEILGHLKKLLGDKLKIEK